MMDLNVIRRVRSHANDLYQLVDGKGGRYAHELPVALLPTKEATAAGPGTPEHQRYGSPAHDSSYSPPSPIPRRNLSSPVLQRLASPGAEAREWRRLQALLGPPRSPRPSVHPVCPRSPPPGV